MVSLINEQHAVAVSLEQRLTQHLHSRGVTIKKS
jgi:hypothetical protein